MSRRKAYFVSLLLLALALSGLVVALYLLPVVAPAVRYRLVDFDDLEGWRQGDQAGALAAFRRSCGRLVRAGSGLAGRGRDWRIPATDWQAVCGRAGATDDAGARRFFEDNFSPVALRSPGNRGLFTGYYEPEIEGALSPSADYATPVLRRPDDLVSVDLGRFRGDLAGRRIAGRVVGGRLVPYPDRRAIVSGGLAANGLVIAWIKNPVDAFFLHIQGSGRIRLTDGTTMRIGYAGQNGHPYTAIGRLLVERGALRPDALSMAGIRRWLAGHPGKAAGLMAENASYIFFRRLDGAGPVGSFGAVLTAGRSLAVDPRFVPPGAPLWLVTRPRPDGPSDNPAALRRLVVAQDTGGAIRGPLRGDLFWGGGPPAARMAGSMVHLGRYAILLPRGAVEALLKAGDVAR